MTVTEKPPVTLELFNPFELDVTQRSVGEKTTSAAATPFDDDNFWNDSLKLNTENAERRASAATPLSPPASQQFDPSTLFDPFPQVAEPAQAQTSLSSPPPASPEFNPFVPSAELASTVSTPPPPASPEFNPFFTVEEPAQAQSKPLASVAAVATITQQGDDLLGLADLPTVAAPTTDYFSEQDRIKAEGKRIAEARKQDEKLYAKKGWVRDPFDEDRGGPNVSTVQRAIATEKEFARAQSAARSPVQHSQSADIVASSDSEKGVTAETKGFNPFKWLTKAFSAFSRAEEKSVTAVVDLPASVVASHAAAMPERKEIAAAEADSIQPKEAAKEKAPVSRFQGLRNFFKSVSLPSFRRSSAAVAVPSDEEAEVIVAPATQEAKASVAPAPAAQEVDVNDFFTIPTPTTSAAAASYEDPFAPVNPFATLVPESIKRAFEDAGVGGQPSATDTVRMDAHNHDRGGAGGGR